MKLFLCIFLTVVTSVSSFSAELPRPLTIKERLRIELWYYGLKAPSKKANILPIPARQKLLWEALERSEQKVWHSD